MGNLTKEYFVHMVEVSNKKDCLESALVVALIEIRESIDILNDRLDTISPHLGDLIYQTTEMKNFLIKGVRIMNESQQDKKHVEQGIKSQSVTLDIGILEKAVKAQAEIQDNIFKAFGKEIKDLKKTMLNEIIHMRDEILNQTRNLEERICKLETGN